MTVELEELSESIDNALELTKSTGDRSEVFYRSVHILTLITLRHLMKEIETLKKELHRENT